MTERPSQKQNKIDNKVKLIKEDLNGVNGGEIVGEVPCPSYSLTEEELQSLYGGGASRYSLPRQLNSIRAELIEGKKVLGQKGLGQKALDT